jgi:hypothetical protein
LTGRIASPEPGGKNDRAEVVTLPPAGVTAGVSPVSAPKLLALQRAAGNRAVNRLIRVDPRILARRTRAVRRGATRRELQRRRLPSAADIQDAMSDPGAGGGPRVASADSAAFEAGIQRLWAQIAPELTAAQTQEFFTQSMFGLTVAQFSALPLPEQGTKTANAMAALAAMTPWERQARFVNALQVVRPGLMLGDPRLIDTGPRPAPSPDAANIAKLVTNANKVFDKIASGAVNAEVDRVFGSANRAAAKAKYAKARTAMNQLKATNHIVTDRSGYNAEVGLGGLTSDKQISLSPETIDNPDKRESVVTIVHESMHAGNFGDVGDNGVYIDRTSEFPKSPVTEKLTNAAHFEVVPRRILPKDNAGDPDDAFAYGGCSGCDPAHPAQTFVPAGTAAPGGAVTPPLTPQEQALKAAYKMFKEAWTLGLNLHNQFVRVFKAPTEWDTLDLSTAFGGVAAGTHFSDCLPFWSKVENLTIHERTHISPAAATASTNPVTTIDIALSEGVVRKLSDGMGAVPDTAAAATAFETAAVAAGDISAADLTAAQATVAGERDLLIKLTLTKRVKTITGSTGRDLAVVLQMGQTPSLWSEILKARAPATFTPPP